MFGTYLIRYHTKKENYVEKEKNNKIEPQFLAEELSSRRSGSENVWKVSILVYNVCK